MAMAEVIGDSPTAVWAAPDSSMICTENLWKTYDMGSEQQVQALRGINLRISAMNTWPSWDHPARANPP